MSNFFDEANFALTLKFMIRVLSKLSEEEDEDGEELIWIERKKNYLNHIKEDNIAINGPFSVVLCNIKVERRQEGRAEGGDNWEI